MRISEKTRKGLWARSHDTCAFPSCHQSLTEDDQNAFTGEGFLTVVGEEAHIRSARLNGPRHDSAYPKDKLDHRENLILLCSVHHTMVDANKGAGYKVATLIKMRDDHERKQQRRTELEQTVRMYLADQYEIDDKIQFQQVDLHGPSVEAMFVDVPFSCRADDPVAELMGRIASEYPGDPEATEGAEGQIVTGAAQALLHPEWSSSALLIGGPGQGKSTLLQYVCQFHRARSLGRANYGADDQKLVRHNGPIRIPIRIDLRKYALWASSKSHSSKGKSKRGTDRIRDDRWPSLEEYVASEIRQQSGGRPFQLQDLAILASTQPLLLAFDGLDEVANLKHRENVSKEIVTTHTRLSVDAVNLVVIVATRPGGTTSALALSPHFPSLYLRRLSQGLRLQYLQQWSAVKSLSQGATTKLQRTFMDNQHVPHIRELASYPMQLAILLHLLYRRALLPQQRTELYREYLKTFLDREQTDDKEPLLAEERKVIEDVHAYLGWYLQTKSEEGTSSGSIKRDELKKLVHEHLAGRADGQKLAEKLFSAISNRVLCLVERDTGSFQFEVQSLREYFAAIYIFHNAPVKGVGNSRDDCLDALLERPYWSNVTRFFVGMFSGVEVRGIRENFRKVSAKISPHPMIRSMAALILDDRTFDGQADGPIQEVVDFVLEGPGVVLAEDGLLDVSGSVLTLAEKAGRAQAVVHLKARLEVPQTRGMRQALASSLYRHAVQDDDLASWWWCIFQPELSWLETAADIGVLVGIGTERIAQLETLLAAVETDRVWLTELLVDRGFSGTSNGVLSVVRDELNEGGGERVDAADRETAVESLVYFSEAAQLRSLPSATATAPPAGRVRVRRNASHTLAAEMSEATAALDKLPKPTTSSSPAQWAAWLLVFDGFWNDGWVIRRALAAIPSSVDLTALASSIPSERVSLRSALKAEVAFRAGKGDLDWWRQRLSDEVSARSRQLWALSLLTDAHQQVVVALAGELSAMVDALPARNYRSLTSALAAAAKLWRPRQLNVLDELRLNKVVFSFRVLWLLRLVATEASAEQINKKLTAGFEILACFDGYDMPAIVRTVGRSKTLKIGLLQGARVALPEGGWASAIKLGAISGALAKTVLSSPDLWPRDVLELALGRVTAKLADGSVALGEAANSAHWFETN